MKTLFTMAAALLASAASPHTPNAASEPRLELYRLDCGSIQVKNLDEFSDTFLYVGRSKALTDSCYVIRNGTQILLWDTGLDGSLVGAPKDDGGYFNSLNVRIIPQLAQIGVRPEDVKFVGISHYHFDHIGQAADFPNATLLISKNDFAVAKAWKPARQRLAPWITGSSTVTEIERDRDVFGDGRVTILSLPGHTEGHQALLVRLASGPVLLSGDTYHFAEQVRNRGIPSFNTSRAESIASMDRFDRIAKGLKAKVVIQHEQNDIAKIAAFPKASH